MGAKVEIKNEKMGVCGGIFLAIDHLRNLGLNNLIDSILGVRTKTGTYQYSDIVEALMSVFFSGGDHIEDINTRLRNDFGNNPSYKLCSSDTALRAIKKLATPNDTFTSKSGINYQFNINRKVNLLPIKGLLKTGLIQKGKSYIFDYDNQFIPTKKHDAKCSYKHELGYLPGIAQINGLPFYAENRDGNANVKFNQEYSLQNSFEILKGEDVHVARGRMDCGSYAKEIIEVIAEYCDKFYIRAMQCDSLRDQINEVPESEWIDVEINEIKCQLTSIPFKSFFEDRDYRLVVQRTPIPNGQQDCFHGNYVYRSILTNDKDMSEKEVIVFYNQRGSSEKCFDVMNNDFGWSHLPCSFMGENLVFMTIMMFIHNYYKYFMTIVAPHAFGLRGNERIKRFVFKFITVPFKWIHRGRQWILKLYTDLPYYNLIV